MLAGYRVLVVEDQPLVAEGLKALLAEAEGVPVGPASSVRDAQHLVKDGPALDAALLDVNLRDGPVTPVLEALIARGVPIVVYTGAPFRRTFASAIPSPSRSPGRCRRPAASANCARSSRPRACARSRGD